VNSRCCCFAASTKPSDGRALALGSEALCTQDAVLELELEDAPVLLREQCFALLDRESVLRDQRLQRLEIIGTFVLFHDRCHAHRYARHAKSDGEIIAR
jgi:hypothetical protein